MMPSATSPNPVSSERRSPLRWFYPAAIAAMVVVASGQSQVAGPNIVHSDKVIHFSVFGLLATLVLRSPGLRRWWGALVVVSIFGISDEIRQSFTPGRSVELADWAADTAGASLAAVLYTFWPWYRRVLEMPLHWSLGLRRKIARSHPRTVPAEKAAPVSVSNDIAARSAS